MTALSPKPITLAIVALLLQTLVACRAMDTHDVDLSPFANERSSFYAESKRGRVGRRGNVEAWASGSLRGHCAAESADAAGPARAVDIVHFDTRALFDTARHELRIDGMRALDELLARIARYGELHDVTLVGHTDPRGARSANARLGTRRVEAVRRHLERRLDHSVAISVASVGEDRPSGGSLADDRRVDVRIRARGRRDGERDIALCNAPTDEGEPGLAAATEPPPGFASLAPFDGQPPLSRGDRVRLTVFADDGFDGLYEIGSDGRLDLPMLGAIGAVGERTDTVEHEIVRRLVDDALVRSAHARIDLSVVQYAAIDVHVSGAVFDPGRRTINAVKPETRDFRQTQRAGDTARERSLATSLAAAGGVRPDADLRRVVVRRGREERIVDLSGVIDGRITRDIPLIDGDVVVVPSSGRFDEGLVRPSQITPPGVRVFVSNLSRPAETNSQSAVNAASTSMPYGTRFLHALLSGNCVGGTQYTNAARRAILVSTHPLTGRTEVIERSVQQLVSDPDRDDINPLLMPNDGVACYDSEVTNIRDIARTFTDVLSPFAILDALIGN